MSELSHRRPSHRLSCGCSWRGGCYTTNGQRSYFLPGDLSLASLSISGDKTRCLRRPDDRGKDLCLPSIVQELSAQDLGHGFGAGADKG